jgi:GNAT superfamily N-acetyltransferase
MLRIEPLAPAHDREAFDCGRPALNDYLRRTARQHSDKGVSRTYVLADDAAPARILGFMTLALCEVVAESLPEKYAKKYPERTHGVKLGRLAVDLPCQRAGYGALMMLHAMRKALEVADATGIVGFFVDAKDPSAQGYYLRFGFIPLPDDPLRLFLPLATLRKATESA